MFRETLAEGDEGALHLGPERPRVYSDLSPEDKERPHSKELHSAQANIKLRILQRQDVADASSREWGVLDEEQLLFIVGGQDNVDDDVDKQPVQDLALNTMFMENLSFADPVYDEADPSYDSDILSEVHDHDNYQDVVCELH
nr:hypothetical protein [Tanacetum cinerariifolium]